MQNNLFNHPSLSLIDHESALKPDSSFKNTVLAFDFGERRIGIAVGEHLIAHANPLITLDTESNDVRFEAIAHLIHEWKPSLLVVGLPMHMDGTAHALTKLCKKFAQRLNGRFKLPVMMVDECLSSVEASEQLKQAGVSLREQKKMLDQVAAMNILNRYFEIIANHLQ